MSSHRATAIISQGLGVGESAPHICLSLSVYLGLRSVFSSLPLFLRPYFLVFQLVCSSPPSWHQKSSMTSGMALVLVLNSRHLIDVLGCPSGPGLSSGHSESALVGCLSSCVLLSAPRKSTHFLSGYLSSAWPKSKGSYARV